MQEHRRRVFSPRLGSMHNLSFSGSSFRKHQILTGLSGLLQITWMHVTDFFARVRSVLVPRRERVYGLHPDSRVVGTLRFGQKVRDTNVPIHHMRVEMWARTWWLGFRKLGQTYTDREGRFVITHDLHYARSWWILSVWSEMYTTGHHRWKGGEPVNDFELFETVKIKKGDLVGMTYDVGTVQLFYWEYNYDTPIPRVIIKDHDKDAPQGYPIGRLDAMERQFIPVELTKLKHFEEIKHGAGRLTIPKIQEDYPENLTVCMEKKQPGITRSDEWFGERMMNGMYASEFDRHPEHPELLWVHYHWSSYQRTDDYAIPDVDMWFHLGDDGLPTPVKICLTGALHAHEIEKHPPPERTFTPDHPQWMYVKRVARVSGALSTELLHHFGGTHVNTEQFAIAAYRNLRRSPGTTLLFPHVKEVVLIDNTADKILIKKGYIQRASALTPDGIDQVVYNRLGTLDWKGFRPMPPLSQAHVYARAANLYWDLIRTYVDAFIEEHADRVRAHWYEVFRFSEDLVQHSVPAFLCGYLHHAMHDDEGRLKSAAENDWYLKEPRLKLPLGDRPMVDGVPRAMSRITTATDFEAAAPADWGHLKDACAYVIFQATFGHTWANSKQYDDIGEVLYSSLGLRFGNGPDGVLAPESDYRISPDLTRSTQMMWWSNMLSRTGYGFITTNEEGDINPKLIEALEAKREEFAALGVNIDVIQSRTNI